MAVRSATLLLLAALACSGGSAEEAGPPSARVERGTLERIVVATGTIEPEREVEVRSRIPGIVEAIHVEAGDDVIQGQVLVEIERELLAAEVREARATLQAAQVEARYARTDLDRMQALRGGGAASEAKLDVARARWESATAQVARTRATLERLDVQLSYATVVAPIDGRVLDVFVEEGTAVASVAAVTGGTLLLSLAATESLHLEGLVDENEVARVRVGQLARIRTEAFPDVVFSGRVREVSPLGKRVQNVTYFEVEVAVEDERSGELRTRMSGDADIVADVVEDALVVPETALHYEGDSIYVEVLDGAEPPTRVQRPVELGIVDDARVQILSGVDEGEIVVLQ